MAAESLGIANEKAFFNLLRPDLPALADVRAAADAGNFAAAKDAWAAHLGGRTSPRWVWTCRDSVKMKQAYGDDYGGLKAHIRAADGVLRREFSFAGIQTTLPKDFDWDQNRLGYEWSNVLNRHGSWQSLAYAWWLTRDPKYAEDWVAMMQDWIEDNPVDDRGSPWRSLEAGSRASSWLNVMDLFMDAPAFDAGMKYLMTRSMVEHARFLYVNNAQFKPGNWQTSEAQGLACLGIMLPEFKESEAWRERAFGLLTTHMDKGVYPDGAQFELTPGYHSHVIHQFLNPLVLAEANGYQIPGLRERHEKMFEFLMHLSRPNRVAAAVGDSKSGVNIQGMMGLGALLYNRSDMRYLSNDQISNEWLWLVPPEKLAAYATMPKTEPSFLSHMMPYAQYGVMRAGWSKDDRWLMFDCAPWGGAHSHRDQLQVTIHSGGRDLLIDPGQVNYDLSISKIYYKKSRAHNVLLINEEESPKDNPEVLAWSVKDNAVFASGRMELEGGVHQRSVLFVKPGYWVVVDHVHGGGQPQVTRLFHFPAGEIGSDDRSVRTRFETGTNLWIGSADSARIEMREEWMGGPTSPKAPVAAFVNRTALPIALCSVLVPFNSPGEIPTVTRLESGDSQIVNIRLDLKDGSTDQIAIAPDVRPLSLDGHEANGVALCVRTKDGKTTVDSIQPEPLVKKVN